MPKWLVVIMLSILLIIIIGLIIIIRTKIKISCTIPAELYENVNENNDKEYIVKTEYTIGDMSKNFDFKVNSNGIIPCPRIPLETPQIEGGDNCNLKGHKIADNAGSEAIILITKKNEVYKIFPIFINEKYAENEKGAVNYYMKMFNTEIQICKVLTKNILDTGISEHLVRYIDDFECDNPRAFFKECPKSYPKYLDQQESTGTCDLYYRQYPVRKLYNKKCKILQMEYCDSSSLGYVNYIVKLPLKEVIERLDVLIFQVLFTIMSIKLKYPYFVHSDLFLRNVLGTQQDKEYIKENKYINYKYKNLEFSIPRKPFFPKIGDFGYTNLNKAHKNDAQLYESDYRDIFPFLLHLYFHIGNLSYNKKLSAKKFEEIRNYFKSFFDIAEIDNYLNKHANSLLWNWDNVIDPEFVKALSIRHPNDLLKNHFKKYQV